MCVRTYMRSDTYCMLVWKLFLGKYVFRHENAVILFMHKNYYLLFIQLYIIYLHGCIFYI